MQLRDRLKYLFLYRLQTEQTQRTLNAQYHQWQIHGYSRILEAKTIFVKLLLFISTLLPLRLRGSANAIIFYIFGLTSSRYHSYVNRYLQFWSPEHIHARVIIRLCPWLIPQSQRQGALNRYGFWIKEATESPASVLNDILDYIESRKDDENWDIHVRNLIEFNIWGRGLVEKPPHLRSHGQWLLKDFPDPKCSDPTRYAIAAAVMEQLVDVFNWRTEHGLRRDYLDTGKEDWENLPPALVEEAPEWAKAVPASPERLVISSAYAREGRSYEQVLAAHGDLDPPTTHFLKRNLIADKNFLQFV